MEPPRGNVPGEPARLLSEARVQLRGEELREQCGAGALHPPPVQREHHQGDAGSLELNQAGGPDRSTVVDGGGGGHVLRGAVQAQEGLRQDRRRPSEQIHQRLRRVLLLVEEHLPGGE